MPLNTKVGLGPGHTALHRDAAFPHKRQFSAHVYCGQTGAHLSYTAEHALVASFTIQILQ